MGKRLDLSAEMLEAPVAPPQAARVVPPVPVPAAPDSPVIRKAQPPVNDKPLQVRWPRAEVKALKLAAADAEQTISEFMLACFHDYIKARKQA